MFDSLTNPITFPDYSSLKELEGKGNYAIGKYYRFPWRTFYRKKLYLVRSLLDKDRVYKNILDFGCGPGIFTPELKRHSINVVSVDKEDMIDSRSRFECIIAASTFEFIDDLPKTVEMLHRVSYTQAQMIVASPTDSLLSKLYFKSIGDNLTRNSPMSILHVVDKYFKVLDFKEWFGLYFAFKGYKR